MCSEPCLTHCTVHLPCGRFAGRIELSRLHTLHTAHTSNDKPAAFEEALAQMLTRTKNCNNKAPILWHVPREILVALRIGLSLDTELFTDPLTFDRGMRSHYSSDDQDSVFGADYDPYGIIWSYYSLCVPPMDDSDMLKALRWAILSAAQPESRALTAVILSSAPSTAYRRLLNHPFVHHIMQVPARTMHQIIQARRQLEPAEWPRQRPHPP